jgi:hypothetical protein
MSAVTPETSRYTGTTSPAGDLSAELENLMDWSDESPPLRSMSTNSITVNCCTW